MKRGRAPRIECAQRRQNPRFVSIERGQHLDIPADADQHRPVGRLERGHKRPACGPRHGERIAFHAEAAIDGQGDRGGKIAAHERCNLLRHVVFQNREVVFGEALDGTALGVT